MWQGKVASCEKCSALLSPVSGPTMEVGLEESPAVTRLQQQVRELELELAKTKLALVESECKNQVSCPSIWNVSLITSMHTIFLSYQVDEHIRWSPILGGIVWQKIWYLPVPVS